LKQIRGAVSVKGVKQWKAIVSLLCLTIWLPATQHCNLEKLPGLGFLHCETDTPGNSDCKGDSCDVVERGVYKAPDAGELNIIPVVAAVLIWTVPAIESATPQLSQPAIVKATSGERSESWQSYSPLALPIRGPSLSS
jgi:hypothetical protein